MVILFEYNYVNPLIRSFSCNYYHYYYYKLFSIIIH